MGAAAAVAVPKPARPGIIACLAGNRRRAPCAPPAVDGAEDQAPAPVHTRSGPH
jgi:hypothetical protein